MENSSRNKINAWVNQQIERSLQLLQPKNIEKFSQFFLSSLAKLFSCFCFVSNAFDAAMRSHSQQAFCLIARWTFLLVGNKPLKRKHQKNNNFDQKVKNLRNFLKLILKNFKKIEKFPKKVTQWRANKKWKDFSTQQCSSLNFSHFNK